MIPLSFFYADETNQKILSAITTSIKEFYFGDNDISLETGKNLSNVSTRVSISDIQANYNRDGILEYIVLLFVYLQMFKSGYFTVDTVEAARHHNNEVFYYLYDHRNERSFNEIFGNLTEELGI